MTPDLPNISWLDSKEALGGMFSIIMMVLHVYHYTLGTKIEWKTGTGLTHPTYGKSSITWTQQPFEVFFVQLPLKSTTLQAHLEANVAVVFFFRLAQVAQKGLFGLFPKVVRWLVDLTLLGTIAYLSMPVATWAEIWREVLFEKSSCKRKVDITDTLEN